MQSVPIVPGHRYGWVSDILSLNFDRRIAVWLQAAIVCERGVSSAPWDPR
jgi:hypothetical protein